jgi:flagellar protein FliO/FliZ
MLQPTETPPEERNKQMPHKNLKSFAFSSIACIAFGAAFPLAAHAESSNTEASASANSELQVTFEEFENEVVIHIRDAGGMLSKPDVVTSRRGYMMSFPNENVATSFHRMNAWRLGRLQTQQYGKRAVVRLEQRRYRPSPLEDNVKIIPVLGGMDIVVEENKVMPKLDPAPTAVADLPTVDAGATAPIASDAETPVVQNSPMEESANPAAAATIAALQRKLGGDVPVDPTQIPIAAARNAAADAATADAPVGTDELATAPEIAVEGTPLFAESTAPEPAAASASPFATGGEASEINRFGLVMMIPTILGLGLLMLWNKKRQTVGAATGRMEVMSKIALGPKQQVIQVKVGGRELLLGVTEHQVGLISDVTASMGASATTAEHLLAGQSIPGLQGPSAAHSDRWTASQGADSPAEAAATSTGDSKVDAFKARLNAALTREMGNNDSGERGEQAQAQQVDDLRRVLSGASDRKDPAWAGTDIQA